jgi:hypothetical protein
LQFIQNFYLYRALLTNKKKAKQLTAPRWRGFAIRAKEQSSLAPDIFCKQFAASEMVA